MKIYVFVFLIIAAVSFALPNEDERQLNLTYEPKFLKLGGNIEDLEEYNRQRKFTCEYMCALRCLFTGYQGSFCSKEGICFCDETTQLKKLIGTALSAERTHF
ncbi:defensin-like [Monomorium pharaonis]|uniref:defensin-like n=1 Tax=Monomorium pharaonis TaxID=307658 RepID=UPI0017476710|nr:defensin-like [Monomorium pharaonis]